MNKLTPIQIKWLTSIKHYINNVTCADYTVRDHLLADGIDKYTKNPVYWKYYDGRKAPISNFASQQNFLRLLVATSLVTGNDHFKQQALAVTRYFTQSFVEPNSRLFYWGGHRFINLMTQKTEGPANKSQVHELKNHLPFYDLLFETNPQITADYIKALWNAHVSDWQHLDFSRHGDYSIKFDPNVFLHPRKDVVDPKKWPKLPETIGLTFINAATDLIYAAYQYSICTGDIEARMWAKHLYRQYVLARCPQTGLPVYQYSSPLAREPLPNDDNRTESWFGDRAKRQFGNEFGDIAIEANVLFRDMAPMDMWPILMDNPLALIYCMKQQPDAEVIDWIVSGLVNYYQYAYDISSNTLRPLWGNGIDMTGYQFQRDGYYGKKGTTLTPIEIKPDYLLPLIQAWLISSNNELEQIIINIFKGLQLVEFSHSLSNPIKINTNSNIASANLIFALIELNSKLSNSLLDELIQIIANNLYNTHFDGNYFIESKQHRFVRIDNIYPLALLAIIAYQQGKYSSLPTPLSRGGYIHGEYLIQGEMQTIYDINYIYQQLN